MLWTIFAIKKPGAIALPWCTPFCNTVAEMADYNERLRVYSSIEMQTEHGHKQIQLLFGDITALPPDHAVDVLLVSAFPGMVTY